MVRCNETKMYNERQPCGVKDVYMIVFQQHL